MVSIPGKVLDRLSAGLKRFQAIIDSARARDVNEADTVVIVMDMLAEMLGFDKYSEITREHCIRGTYCDLAIKINGCLAILIEVKAVGIGLKETHLKQAVDYAANQGVEWVILTNGAVWRVYHVLFNKPIDNELVLDLDFQSLSYRIGAHLEKLYLITKESILKSALQHYNDQQQVTSRFYLASILLGDPAIDLVRRELRRLYPDAKVQPEEIRQKLLSEVLKRDVTEGPEAEQAHKKIQKAANKSLRARRSKETGDPEESPAPAVDSIPNDEKAETLSLSSHKDVSSTESAQIQKAPEV